MPDRDWDKELAKIDKQLASISDDALLGPTPVQIPAKGKGGVPAKSTPAPKAEKRAAAVREPTETKAWAVYLRLLIAIALGVGIFWWPYQTRCGAGLAGYLAANVAVIVGGLWSAVWTWKHRAARSHTLSLLIVLLGMVLGAIQVLPRIGKLVAHDEGSYRYLAESIRKHPDQQTLKAMMEAAGFRNVQVRNLSAGIVAIHRGYKL